VVDTSNKTNKRRKEKATYVRHMKIELEDLEDFYSYNLPEIIKRKRKTAHIQLPIRNFTRPVRFVAGSLSILKLKSADAFVHSSDYIITVK